MGDANAEAGGIDADGSLLLNDSTVSGDHVRRRPSGTLALAIEGRLQVQGSLVAHRSRISGGVVARAPAGSPPARTGERAQNNLAQATLEDTVVSGNRVTANGPFGATHGGGVSNFTLDPNNPPNLKVLNSSITGNTAPVEPPASRPRAAASWTDQPLLLVQTTIAGNSPDQCFGC